MAVDRAIGEILAALPNGGRDAWVIVTADHGEGLGEHGEPTHGLLLYDSTLQDPARDQAAAGARARASTRDGARAARRHPADDPRRRGRRGRARDDGRTLVARRPTTGDEPSRSTTAPRRSTAGTSSATRGCARSATASRKLIEGGGKAELYDDARSIRARRRISPSTQARRSRAPQEAPSRRARAARRRAKRSPRSTFPIVAGPYIGGRPPGTALEPTEDENAKLPRAQDRWNVVTDLEDARAALRSGNPGRAMLILKPHASELATNPALLFWTARAHQELGEKPGASGSGAPRRARRGREALSRREVAVRRSARPRLGAARAARAPRDHGRRGRLEAARRARGRGRSPRAAAPRSRSRSAESRNATSGTSPGAEADLAEAARRDPGNPAHRRGPRRGPQGRRTPVILGRETLSELVHFWRFLRIDTPKPPPYTPPPPPMETPGALLSGLQAEPGKSSTTSARDPPTRVTGATDGRSPGVTSP